MKFKLEIFPALEVTQDSKVFKFDTHLELNAAYDSCSMLLLFIQDDITCMKDYSNSFIKSCLVDGEWTEIDDADEWDES